MFPPLRRRTKDRLHHSKRYDSIRLQAGSKALSTINQPDRESATSVEPPIGSGEVAQEGHAVTNHEVRAHIIMWIHQRDYEFVQVPGDVQAENLQVAGVNPIYRPTDFPKFHRFHRGSTVSRSSRFGEERRIVYIIPRGMTLYACNLDLKFYLQ